MAYVAYTNIYQCSRCDKMTIGEHNCIDRTMRTPITEDTNFSVYVSRESSSGSMAVKYEIYNALDDPDYSYRYAYGWAANEFEAEKKARKEINKLMKPYRKPPKASDFIPPFLKRVM